MNWRFAFRALAAELRRRAGDADPENDPMVKCGAEKAEVVGARAQAYRWIASELEDLDAAPGREALSRIRRWAERTR